jgi:hypothetical protein
MGLALLSLEAGDREEAVRQAKRAVEVASNKDLYRKLSKRLNRGNNNRVSERAQSAPGENPGLIWNFCFLEIQVRLGIFLVFPGADCAHSAPPGPGCKTRL